MNMWQYSRRLGESTYGNSGVRTLFYYLMIDTATFTGTLFLWFLLLFLLLFLFAGLCTIVIINRDLDLLGMEQLCVSAEALKKGHLKSKEAYRVTVHDHFRVLNYFFNLIQAFRHSLEVIFHVLKEHPIIFLTTVLQRVHSRLKFIV